MEGIQETAPNSIKVGRVCKVKTKPMINPATETRKSERLPML